MENSQYDIYRIKSGNTKETKLKSVVFLLFTN